MKEMLAATIVIFGAAVGCNQQQQDFGTKVKADCESVYRQIVELKEQQGMLDTEIGLHEYGRRWEAMSPKEKEAEKAAAHRNAVAIAESKAIDENVVKAKIARERLQFVERCVRERAMRRQ